jgi:hypothetical protein
MPTYVVNVWKRGGIKDSSVSYSLQAAKEEFEPLKKDPRVTNIILSRAVEIHPKKW